MMSAVRAHVAAGVEVEFTFDPETRAINVMWHPDLPRRLDGQAIRRYRAIRADFLRRVAAHVGGAVAVIETDGLTTTIINSPEGGHA